MWDHPCEQAPELSETLTQYSTLVVLRFLTTTPNLPSQSTSIPRRTRRTQLKETWRTRGQEPTLPLSLDLTRPLVNHWSPLSHASHCMTSTRPAAATQMRARINPAMQPKVFIRQMPFLPQPCIPISQLSVVLPNRSRQPATTLLSELHWLRVNSRITFKLACLTYKLLTTSQPAYLCTLLHQYTPTPTNQSVTPLTVWPLRGLQQSHRWEQE